MIRSQLITHRSPSVISYMYFLILNLSVLLFRTAESASREVPSQLSFSQAGPNHVGTNEGTVSKKVTFGDIVRSNEVDEPDNRGHPNDREPSVNWNSKASVTTTLDDPNSSYSPYLPPVLEEPSSSFSEGLTGLNSVSLLLRMFLVGPGTFRILEKLSKNLTRIVLFKIDLSLYDIAIGVIITRIV